MMTQPHPDAGDIEFDVDAVDAAAGEARSALTREVGGRVEEDVLADAELVLSELVANAAEHGTGPSIPVKVHVDGPGRGVRVTVRNRSDATLPERPWRMPAPDAVRGRGLAVTETLSSRIEVHDGGGTVEVSAVIGPPSAPR